MRKFLTLAAVVAIAACGEKKAETPEVDTTAAAAPAPAPAMDSAAAAAMDTAKAAADSAKK